MIKSISLLVSALFVSAIAPPSPDGGSGGSGNPQWREFVVPAGVTEMVITLGSAGGCTAGDGNGERSKGLTIRMFVTPGQRIIVQ